MIVCILIFLINDGLLANYALQTTVHIIHQDQTTSFLSLGPGSRPSHSHIGEESK